MSAVTPIPVPNAPDFNVPSTWGPNVPSKIRTMEKMALAGNNLTGVFYGITVVLFFQCMRSLWNGQLGIRRPLFVYVTISFILCTLFTAFNMNIVTMGFVENRNFPGSPGLFPPGPQGYIFYSYSNWKVIIPNTCFIISNWMADGLLMFRCFILYNRHIAVLILPVLIYCAPFSMGVITIYKTSQPDSSIFSHVSFDFALPYFTISVALNISLTLIMSARIVYHLNQMNRGGPISRNISNYSNIITILVESCALYAINSILFIGTYGAGHDASTIFLPLLSQTQVIAPYLIILRVATNQSVTSTIATTKTLAPPAPGFWKTTSSVRNSTEATRTDSFQLRKVSMSYSGASNQTLDVPHINETTRRSLEESRLRSPLGWGANNV